MIINNYPMIEFNTKIVHKVYTSYCSVIYINGESVTYPLVHFKLPGWSTSLAHKPLPFHVTIIGKGFTIL